MDISFLCQNQNQAIITNGLVGYWGFNEGTGSFVRDFSTGSFNTASLKGSPAPTWTNGKVGGAMKFPTSNVTAYLQTSNTFATSPLAAFAWIYITAYIAGTVTVGIVNHGETLDNNSTSTLGMVTGSVAYAINGYSSAASNIATSSAIVPLNQWNFIGYNRQTSTIDIWTNGTKLNVPNPTGGTGGGSAGNPILIGTATTNKVANGFFVGNIDEVRVYNRTLTDNEVLALYNL